MQAKFFKPIMRLPKSGRKFLSQFNKGIPVERISGRRYYALLNPVQGATFDIPDGWTTSQLQEWALSNPALQGFVVVFYNDEYHILQTPALFDFGLAKVEQILQWHTNGRDKWVVCETAPGAYESAPLHGVTVDKVASLSKNKPALQEGKDFIIL